MFSPTTSSSPMPSRCLTSARRLLPCAATRTVAPLRRSGTIASYQYGSMRTTTSARHSVAGRASGGRNAYRASWSCENSLPGSIAGGGVQHVGQQAVLGQELPAARGLLPALRREGHVHPAGEEVGLVPLALAVAEQH